MKYKTTIKADLLLDILEVVESNVYGTIKDNDKFVEQMLNKLDNYNINKGTKNGNKPN